MHAVIGADGNLIQAGPTLERIAPGCAGRPFFERFDIRRPCRIDSIEALRRFAPLDLRVRLTGPAPLDLRGVAVLIEGGSRALLNLSFGVHIREAVSKNALSLDDFAATDLAVEMLYLIEAKDAAMAENNRLIQRLEAARSDAEALSATDPLTGLPNRRALESDMKQLVELSQPFAVMAIDLDFFKEVNDTHGHSAGDAVLVETAGRLTAHLDTGDILARIGGDEFLAIVRGDQSEARLDRLARAMIDTLKRPYAVDDIRCRIAASIGISQTDGGGDDTADDLVALADAALYDQSGRDAAVSRSARAPLLDRLSLRSPLLEKLMLQRPSPSPDPSLCSLPPPSPMPTSISWSVKRGGVTMMLYSSVVSRPALKRG